jgi:hypothetical protein
VKINVLIEKRRLIVQAAGWSLIDLDLMSRLRATPARTIPGTPGHDPHGTLASQVEQAAEPSPGFGFAGSVTHVVARKDPP